MSKVRDIVGNIGGASTSPVVTIADIASSTPIAGSNVELVSGVSKNLLGIGGAGYSWVDETVNRVADTTYTNTTGRPIMLKVGTSIGSDTSLNYSIEIYVDGVPLGFNSQPYGDNSGLVETAIVPDGSTFKTHLVRCSLLTWFELK